MKAIFLRLRNFAVSLILSLLYSWKWGAGALSLYALHRTFPGTVSPAPALCLLMVWVAWRAARTLFFFWAASAPEVPQKNVNPYSPRKRLF